MEDSVGNIVATAIINLAKTVSLTWTSYVDTYSDIRGNLYFSVQIDSSTVTEVETVPLSFTVGTDTVFGAGDIDYVQ